LVLDVVSVLAGGSAKTTVVSVESHVVVTGKGSSTVVVTFRVKVFFHVHDLGIRLFFVIMGTLV